jgi:hypothetical protein
MRIEIGKSRIQQSENRFKFSLCTKSNWSCGESGYCDRGPSPSVSSGSGFQRKTQFTHPPVLPPFFLSLSSGGRKLPYSSK